MPRIDEVTLTHFRSHTGTKLSLDGRLVVLLGANGAGKTNILEALSLLSPGRGLRGAVLADLAQRAFNHGWKIRAKITAQGPAHDLEIWAEGVGGRLVQQNGKRIMQHDLAKLLRIVWLVPMMDRLWLEGAEGRRRFLDRMVLSFEPDHGPAALIYEKALRERGRLLKEGITDPHWYMALEAQMADAGARLRRYRAQTVERLNKAGLEDALFPQVRLSLTGDEAGQELAGFWAGSRRHDLAAGRTLHGPHRVDMRALYIHKGIAAADCSTGEQKALLISLILANARALAREQGHPPVLLLDELGAHLDAGRRAALFDHLADLGVQAFMTGTEADIFHPLGRRAQWFRVADHGAGSTVHEISAPEMGM